MIDKEACEVSLRAGARFPYDGAEPPQDWAHEAARAIVSDLRDRTGMSEAFEDIDTDKKAEIVATLSEIIRIAHERSGKCQNKEEYYPPFYR